MLLGVSDIFLTYYYVCYNTTLTMYYTIIITSEITFSILIYNFREKVYASRVNFIYDVDIPD